MLTQFVLALALAAAVLGMACGDGAEDDLSIVADMVLQPEDVPSNYAPNRTEIVSNDFFGQQLGERYGMPGNAPDGRLDGYLSSFSDHPAYISNRVDLFRTGAQASDFLAAPVEFARTRAFDVSKLGDKAIAYPTRLGDCPCIIRFRRGEAVAEVYYEGPRATGELEDTLSLARKIDQRIADAFDR